jgi:hypothetical protein
VLAAAVLQDLLRLNLQVLVVGVVYMVLGLYLQNNLEVQQH